MKTVLITGSAGLLGSALVKYYKSIKYSYDPSGRAYKIIGIDKEDTTKLKELPDQYIQTDFSEIIHGVNDDTICLGIDFKNVDILINCLGYSHLSWIENIEIEDLYKSYNINVFAPFIFMRGMIRDNLNNESRIRTICNVVSIGSKMSMRTSMEYCTTKSAYAMMTKQASREVSGKHPQFRIFGINPCGFTDGTDKIGGIIEDVLPQMLTTRPKQFPDIESAKKYNLQSPTGSLLKVDDLVKFITFMIEFNNVHMNGSLIDFWDAMA